MSKTLYSKDCDYGQSEDHTIGGCMNPVGDFRQINWCKAHNMSCMTIDGDQLKSCEHGAYWGLDCEVVKTWHEMPSDAAS